MTVYVAYLLPACRGAILCCQHWAQCGWCRGAPPGTVFGADGEFTTMKHSQIVLHCSPHPLELTPKRQEDVLLMLGALHSLILKGDHDGICKGPQMHVGRHR